MYVTYEFYKAVFGGGGVPADDFPRTELQAEAHIRAMTYVNGDIFATEAELVKIAVCAAAEVIYNQEKKTAAAGGSGAIRSENNDGFSVSYVAEGQDGQTAEEITRKKVYEAVRLYLLPTGWLSRRVKMGGACHDHDCCCDHL